MVCDRSPRLKRRIKGIASSDSSKMTAEWMPFEAPGRSDVSMYSPSLPSEFITGAVPAFQDQYHRLWRDNSALHWAFGNSAPFRTVPLHPEHIFLGTDCSHVEVSDKASTADRA